MENKKLSGVVPLTVLLVVLVIISAFDLWITPKEAEVEWQYQTTLAEDIVFYSDSVYGMTYTEPVSFKKGDSMKVCIDLTRRSAVAGRNETDFDFDHSFIYGDGTIYQVLVTTDKTKCAEQTSDAFDTPYVSAIHISQVDYYESILSSFEKEREAIIKKDTNARLKNVVIGTVCVIGLAVGMLILRHARVKNGQSANQLFWIFLSIDCVFIIFGIAKLVMWFSQAS